MKIVIDIPKEFEEHFNSDRFEDSLARIASDIESFGFQLAGRYEQETITMLRKAIKNSTPLPDDAKILTKEAYSDLCMKAAPDFESEEYINERINNYNKMLKSGILDCIMEKSQESEDEE